MIITYIVFAIIFYGFIWGSVEDLETEEEKVDHLSVLLASVLWPVTLLMAVGIKLSQLVSSNER